MRLRSTCFELLECKLRAGYFVCFVPDCPTFLLPPQQPLFNIVSKVDLWKQKSHHFTCWFKMPWRFPIVPGITIKVLIVVSKVLPEFPGLLGTPKLALSRRHIDLFAVPWTCCVLAWNCLSLGTCRLVLNVISSVSSSLAGPFPPSMSCHLTCCTCT